LEEDVKFKRDKLAEEKRTNKVTEEQKEKQLRIQATKSTTKSK